MSIIKNCFLMRIGLANDWIGSFLNVGKVLSIMSFDISYHYL